APITDAEIIKSLLSIPDERAPGPDGYTTLFFKKNWDIIGMDILDAVHSFFLSGKLPSFINSVTLALVPKKINASDMKDFHPISCCNVLYEIVSKILANRLYVVLPSVISHSQTTFIKGRNVGDIVLLAHELLRSYNRSGVSPRCALKIDLMKAFDSVEWQYILKVLEAMDFPSVFVDWLHTCFKSTRLSINLNGSLQGYFSAMKGFRQGVPISPIFLLLLWRVWAIYLLKQLQGISSSFTSSVRS
ncbi:Transposon TX1 uncharacterized 149 kDa protein, partial [Linum perenne]